MGYSKNTPMPESQKMPKEWFEQSLKQAHANYKTTINYYRKKASMLQQVMNDYSQQAANEVWRNVITGEMTAIQQDPEIYDTLNKTVETELVPKLKEYADSIMNDDIRSAILSSPGRTSATSKNYLRNYEQRTREAVNNALQYNSMVESIINKAYFDVFSHNPGAAAANALKALFRRQLILNATSIPGIRQSVSGYTQIFKGDLGEDLAEQALGIFGKRAGELTGVDKKATRVDVVIDTRGGANTLIAKELEKIVRNLDIMDKEFDKNIILTANLPDPDSNQRYYGAQVKSWTLPTVQKPTGGRNYYDIGSRADLKKSLGFDQAVPPGQKLFARGWHHSVELLSQILPGVLGTENVFFISRGNLYWTHEVIAHMHALNYYVSFYFSRKTNQSTREYDFTYPTNGDIAWTQQMYKNTYVRKK